MGTLICRTCGCSLVRLGVSSDKSAAYRHKGKEHRFCCQGCADVFVTNPQQYLQETDDLIVCPTCLAEKPLQVATGVTIAGQVVHFCRCPLCPEAFQKKPNFYISRLEGTESNEGVVDHKGCCVRPA